MSSHERIEQNDEGTPLLRVRETVHPNPLPKGQMFALMLLMTAEPLMGLSILPYITEVCSSLIVWWRGQAEYSGDDGSG
jgi:hypothetical protein